MPRSERHQKSIDRHRTTLALPPKPVHGEKCPDPWWTRPMSREEFSAEMRKQQARMAPHSGIAGDRGVSY